MHLDEGKVVKVKGKVTYLPIMKQGFKTIANNVNRLIQKEQYGEALEQINTLINHSYNKDDLFAKKLHCLAELERWQEVEQLSESLRHDIPNEFTAQYDLFYILSLYHLEQHELLIDIVDLELASRKMPENIRKVLMEFYEKSKQLVYEQTIAISEQMQVAILSQNDREQWRLFHQWDKLNTPPPELFIYMLEHEQVNPIVKTYIIEALKTWNVNEEVTIVKGAQRIQTTLHQFPLLQEDEIYLKTVKEIAEIEQSNPTLYGLVLELLQPYVEFHYPFLYDEQDVTIVSQALITLALSHLEGTLNESTPQSSKLVQYQKEITASNEAYFQLLIT